MATIINRFHLRLRAGTRHFLPLPIRLIMTVSNDLPVFDATHRELKSHVAEKKNDGSNGPLKKPHGRAFYESIGSPKFILAPMVDQSEFVS